MLPALPGVVRDILVGEPNRSLVVDGVSRKRAPQLGRVAVDVKSTPHLGVG